MMKAESLLKVIQAPPEAVGDMFRQLLPDANVDDLRKARLPPFPGPACRTRAPWEAGHADLARSKARA